MKLFRSINSPNKNVSFAHFYRVSFQPVVPQFSDFVEALTHKKTLRNDLKEPYWARVCKSRSVQTKRDSDAKEMRWAMQTVEMKKRRDVETENITNNGSEWTNGYKKWSRLDME